MNVTCSVCEYPYVFDQIGTAKCVICDLHAKIADLQVRLGSQASREQAQEIVDCLVLKLGVDPEDVVDRVADLQAQLEDRDQLIKKIRDIADIE
jgi:hypothetical protein